MKFAKVKWIDCCSDAGWKGADYIGETLKVTSVGIVWAENKKTIVLAQSLDEQGQPGDLITIPKICVQKIKRLK